jgi:3-hydroxyisobutyrate dehydrogenase-like beta-hydroxyacid dehydrogenase
VAQEVAAGLTPLGVVSLDAPVSGGVVGAKAGTLTIMVSGDAVAYETVRPALLEIGRNTMLVGDQVGQGQTLKLVNNLMAAANYAVASECLVLGAKAGLDADMMVDVINKSSGRSFVSETFVAKAVLSREFDFGFRLELMNKDIRLALEEAETLGTPMFICSAARQLYAYAMALGAGPSDVTTLIKVLEQWGTLRSRAKDRKLLDRCPVHRGRDAAYPSIYRRCGCPIHRRDQKNSRNDPNSHVWGQRRVWHGNVASGSPCRMTSEFAP